MPEAKQQKVVDLPHGASICEDAIVSLPVGNVILKFPLEDWKDFFQIVDDINVVLKANTIESIIQCPTCNTITSYVEYEEPTDEEFN